MSARALTMPLTRSDESETGRLVRLAKAGDTQAFGRLVEPLWQELVPLARSILAGDAEAEDQVQESLVRAWQRLRALRDPERFAPWVRRIVARRCLTRARRRRRWGELGEPAAPPVDAGASLDAARLLSVLPPRQRAALYLTWIEGCTDREAARVLGIRPATVRVHRARGLAALRRHVEEG